MCDDLGLDPKNWQDPTTQVRVGLAYFVDQIDWVRRILKKKSSAKLLDELFPKEGTEWYVAGLIMLPHVGIGDASAILLAHKDKLLALPEEERWNYLQSANGRKTRAAMKNVIPKMVGYDELVRHVLGRAAAKAASAIPDIW